MFRCGGISGSEFLDVGVIELEILNRSSRFAEGHAKLRVDAARFGPKTAAESPQSNVTPS
jgi:hypothetical protein